MAATGHALLSPSSSHRWIHCTPSARLEEGVPDTGSVYAEEGSCAHALCECGLLRLLEAERGDGYTGARREAEREFEAGRERFYNAEMQEAVDMYVALVWEKYREAVKTTLDAELFVERRLDFGKYIPGSFGTADAIVIADGLMEVVDFKYGKGVEVSATGNTQMMIYALGALDAYSWEYDIRRVRMTIVQPRKANVSEYELGVEDLARWQEEVLSPAARKADRGEGEQQPGEWCRFCKVRARCARLADQATAAYLRHERKETISDTEMPPLLALLPAIKAWAVSVEEYALARAVSGVEFPGWKVVEGRSVRKVADPVTLRQRLLDAGARAEDICKPTELRPIGELEKLVGKKEFARLAEGCVEKPEGKPALVPSSDKRAAKNYSTAQADFESLRLD